MKLEIPLASEELRLKGDIAMKSMRSRQIAIFSIFAGLVFGLIARGGDLQSIFAEELKLSKPVVCKSIKGFRDYVELNPPELTTFDKLLIYVEPTGFALIEGGEKKKAHLIQGGRVRAKGSKKVIFERDELFKYEPELATGRETLYLGASFGFKNLKPGEYVLDLETTDKAAKPEQKITQQIDFIIIPEKNEK